MYDHMKAEIAKLIESSITVENKPRRARRKAPSMTVSGTGNIVAGRDVIHISLGGLSDEHFQAMYQAVIGK